MKEGNNIKQRLIAGFALALPITIILIVALIVMLDTAIEAAFDNVSNQVKLIAFVILVFIGLYFLIRKIVKS